MRNVKAVLAVAVFLISTFEVLLAGGGNRTLPLDISLTPTSSIKGPGPVTIKLVAKKNWQCDSASIELKPKGQMSILGTSSWSFVPREGDSTIILFDLVIPAGDTSGVELSCKCGTLPFYASMYFVTTGDTAEVWYGYPEVTVANPPPHLPLTPH